MEMKINWIKSSFFFQYYSWWWIDNRKNIKFPFITSDSKHTQKHTYTDFKFQFRFELLYIYKNSERVPEQIVYWFSYFCVFFISITNFHVSISLLLIFFFWNFSMGFFSIQSRSIQLPILHFISICYCIVSKSNQFILTFVDTQWNTMMTLWNATFHSANLNEWDKERKAKKKRNESIRIEKVEADREVGKRNIKKKIVLSSRQFYT